MIKILCVFFIFVNMAGQSVCFANEATNRDAENYVIYLKKVINIYNMDDEYRYSRYEAVLNEGITTFFEPLVYFSDDSYHNVGWEDWFKVNNYTEVELGGQSCGVKGSVYTAGDSYSLSNIEYTYEDDDYFLVHQVLDSTLFINGSLVEGSDERSLNESAEVISALDGIDIKSSIHKSRVKYIHTQHGLVGAFVRFLGDGVPFYGYFFETLGGLKIVKESPFLLSGIDFYYLGDFENDGYENLMVILKEIHEDGVIRAMYLYEFRANNWVLEYKHKCK